MPRRTHVRFARCARSLLPLTWLAILVALTAPRAGGAEPATHPDEARGAPAARVTAAAMPLAGPATLLPFGDAARPARGQAAQAYDEAGGDDVVIATATDMMPYEGPSMDIADNGDIYVAVTVDADPGAGLDREIRVYWSQDDGVTWSLFGTLASAVAGTQYANPSLHVGEGGANRLFVACEYYESGVPGTIRVCTKPLASPGTAWTERTALSDAAVSFRNPSIHSQEANVLYYQTFLAAEGVDGNGDDIWFTRSGDYADTWAAGYKLASLSAGDRDYILPKVRYGSSGVVNCTWMFHPQPATGLDDAIRYRRALNSAASAADWEPVLYLTASNNGEHERYPDLAASLGNDDVLVTYVRLTSEGLVLGCIERRSTDLGATWPAGDFPVPVTFNDALVALPGGGFLMGGEANGADRFGLTKATGADPTTWSSFVTLMDRDWFDGYGNPQADNTASSPSFSHRGALTWIKVEEGAPDSLLFDAEWRRDPGWPNLAAGFPVVLPANVTSPPAICEIDGDATREIVFGDAAGKVQVYNHDGTVVAGWPQDVGSIPYDAPIAVGDIDADGRNEVVVGNTAGEVYAFEPDGTVMAGFPYAGPVATNVFVSLGRFGADSRLDIVAADGNRLFKLRSDGTRFPDLAITFSNALAGPAAIGDVDGDGDNEYAILQSGFMDVVTPEAGVQAFRSLAGRTFSAPAALADLDLDGDLEIMAGSDQGDVYVMNPDGSDFPGWPSLVSSGGIVNSPIAANISGNAPPELFWSERGSLAPEVHGFFADGTEMIGFPTATTPGWYVYGSPIADHLGGGSPDLFIGSRDGYAHSWTNFGVVNAGWPKPLGGRCEMSPASGDVNADGLLDLVFTTVAPGQLVVLETNYPMHRSPDQVTEWWPMYGYNPERQFCLACSPQDLVTGVAPGPRPKLQLRALPNPGRAFRFRVELPETGEARLDVFDLHGRRVRTLVHSALPAGVHTIAWDARLDGGARAGAGIYYARLTLAGSAGTREAVQKVALVP